MVPPAKVSLRQRPGKPGLGHKPTARRGSFRARRSTSNVALWTTGFGADEVTGHGFQATARTMLHERLRFSPDATERWAHAVRDSLGRAYK